MTRRKKNQQSQSQSRMQKKHLLHFMSNLNPVPFLPNKTLDFSNHHILLKRLCLWNFANLDFNHLASTLRPELVAQLIATFDPENLCSVVDGATIPVSCADLARVLKLPGKRVYEETGMGIITKDSIHFVVDFVFNWMVLKDESDDETWIIPKAVSDCVEAVKEGKFEEVDWAALVWSMVERELIRGRQLRNCYYATHMMCLIKEQIKEDKEISSEMLNTDGQNSVTEAQRSVIWEQDAVIKAKQSVIEEQQKLIDSYKLKIEEQEKEHGLTLNLLEGYKEYVKQIKSCKATIDEENVGNGEFEALIEEQQKREGLYKAKIEEQEKEQGLMMNLLEGYREAVKRNQMAFSEFRESCECKHLHKPVYKDVPGVSGLVSRIRGLSL